MEKIALVVDQLNLAPFNKGYSSLAEYDSHSGFELLEILCEILIAISPDQTPILKENIELKVQRIIQFLEIMKYDMSDDGLLQKLTSISKDTINKIILYCFENFDTLKKRAYLAKFLLPVTVPSDFISDDLVYELLQNLKELQVQFKDIHKEADQLDNIGDKTNHLKVEITQLEQEKNQLQNKIQRMKRDSQEDEIYFRDMLRATTVLRSAQEDEAAIYQRLSEHRQVLRDTEIKLTDSSQRLNSIKSDGIQKLSADQLVSKMQCDVKILYDRREALTATLSDRTQHLEKIGSWSVSSDRTGTYEDVQVKREQIRALQDDIKQAQARLDACDNASKLAVFRQAATMAEKKLREREDEVNKLIHERKRVLQLVQDKESALTNFIDAHSSSTAGHDNNSLRIDVAKKSALCKEQHNELGALRSELVVLQRTEQILTNKFINAPGGSRPALEMLIKRVDAQLQSTGPRHSLLTSPNPDNESIDGSASRSDSTLEGATVEQVSTWVEQTSREFKQRQSQLQPVMIDLRRLRQEYAEIEAEYTDKKQIFEKQTVGLDIEKQALEKQCDVAQEECLREESRFHYLQNVLSLNKNRIEKVEQEQRWRDGNGRMMRDFTSFKTLYDNKLNQQEQLIKALRKRQRDLKELTESVGDQKKYFHTLDQILSAKLEYDQ